MEAELAGVSDEFILVRVLNMRGVNLNVFDFDYDLTWAAFFLNANEHVYGRYGGRDAGEADARLSIKGLRHALNAARTAHKAERELKPAATPAGRTAEQFEASKRLKANACIHCHMVYDFWRTDLRATGNWSRDRIWLYPQPENIGLALEVDRGNYVREVRPDSSAARAGIQKGDVLQQLAGVRIASIADVQFALHHAPMNGELHASWKRGETSLAGKLKLEEGWKKTDISWRAFMWGLEPTAAVYGHDLSSEEKKELGLGEKRLAFRQGGFVPAPSRQAGIKQNDIILGIDGKEMEMTMLQFNAFVRLNFKVGDKITFNIIRGGKRLDIPMTLQARDN